MRADDLSRAGDVDDGTRGVLALSPGLRRAEGVGGAAGEGQTSGVDLLYEEADKEGKKTWRSK